MAFAFLSPSLLIYLIHLRILFQVHLSLTASLFYHFKKNLFKARITKSLIYLFGCLSAELRPKDHLQLLI